MREFGDNTTADAHFPDHRPLQTVKTIRDLSGRIKAASAAFRHSVSAPKVVHSIDRLRNSTSAPIPMSRCRFSGVKCIIVHLLTIATSGQHSGDIASDEFAFLDARCERRRVQSRMRLRKLSRWQGWTIAHTKSSSCSTVFEVFRRLRRRHAVNSAKPSFHKHAGYRSLPGHELHLWDGGNRSIRWNCDVFVDYRSGRGGA